MRRLWLLTSLLTLTGCPSSSEVDAGARITLDDAGDPDAGVDAGSGDGGPPDAGALCTARPVAMSAACAETTRVCWSGCTSQACVDGCVASDPSPDCAVCFAVNEIVCVLEAGCAAELGALDCCRQAECPADGLEEPACTDGACSVEYDLFLACGADRVGFGGCAGAVSSCF